MRDGSGTSMVTLLNSASNGESSFHDGGMCEKECAKEQTALVQCMDQISNKVETDTEKAKTTHKKCLEPAISSWINCCLAVNEREACRD